MENTEIKTTRFEMRASVEWVARVDNWRRRQPSIPSRADAIRKLVDVGAFANYLAEKVLSSEDFETVAKELGGKLLMHIIDKKIQSAGPGSYLLDPDFPNFDPDTN